MDKVASGQQSPRAHRVSALWGQTYPVNQAGSPQCKWPWACWEGRVLQGLGSPLSWDRGPVPRPPWGCQADCTLRVRTLPPSDGRACGPRGFFVPATPCCPPCMVPVLGRVSGLSCRRYDWCLGLRQVERRR